MLLLLLAGGGWWWFHRARPTVVRTILVQQPSSRGIDRTLLNASGFVTPRREATVSSKFTGKVIEVLVEEGMKVDAGQVLARIDPVNVEKSLLLAEAQAESTSKALEETRASLEQAEREFRRVLQLAKEKIAAQSELDRTESEVKALKARLAKQQADVKVTEREVAIWKQQLDDTIIRAPFAGIVTSKNAQPGEMISPMSSGGFTRTGICTLVDMSSLEVEVEVSESYINRVEAGQPVEATLDSYPEWKIPTKVIAIIPTADRVTNRLAIWIERRETKFSGCYNRGDSFQSVYARLTSPQAFQPFKEALTSNPQLKVKAVRQVDFLADQSSMLTGFIDKIGVFIAGLMGLGALFGALNTMYSAIADRTREIATLRALGFGSSPIILSVLFESLGLALLGGMLGAAAAYFAFDGFKAATINWQTFSQVAFAFTVTPALLVKAILWAAGIGLIGGLFPAIRAARLPIAAGLRET